MGFPNKEEYKPYDPEEITQIGNFIHKRNSLKAQFEPLKSNLLKSSLKTLISRLPARRSTAKQPPQP